MMNNASRTIDVCRSGPTRVELQVKFGLGTLLVQGGVIDQACDWSRHGGKRKDGRGVGKRPYLNCQIHNPSPLTV